MRIVLNGDPVEVPGPLSVVALLAHLKIDPRLVAVECNRKVIKRASYADTLVTDGAEVEIVAFVGGGHGRAGPGRRRGVTRA
jgi:sulfur carrier protein